jgi:hypothetical protein
LSLRQAKTFPGTHFANQRILNGLRKQVNKEVSYRGILQSLATNRAIQGGVRFRHQLYVDTLGYQE